MSDPPESDCGYCGLPVSRIAVDAARRANNESALYCCLGCRIAASLMQGDETSSHRSSAVRLGIAVFFTMNVMVFTMVLWTWNVHDLVLDAKANAFREVLRYGCLLFSTPVVLLLGSPLIEASLDAWRDRRFTTDVLLLVGVGAAYGYSLVSLLRGMHDVYFEVACVILVAVTLGRWLEATAKWRANQTIRSLRQLMPEKVRLVADYPIRDTTSIAHETCVSLDEICAGDVLRVLAGERIPTDGVVLNESGFVDEQVITGESLPRALLEGDFVMGGTLNLDGDLFVRTRATSQESAIARLVMAVEAAASASCRVIRQADRLAAAFVPVILVSTLAAWGLHAANGWQDAGMAALSVVLIACPCALGIATPLALWVGINTAARHGVLFRDGDAIVSLARVRSMGLDKTGTITRGDASLIRIVYDDPCDEHMVCHISRTLAASSNHVLSRAIALALSETPAIQSQSGTPGVFVDCARDRAGMGVAASLHHGRQTSTAVLGSVALAMECGLAVSEHLAMELRRHPHLAVVCVGWEGHVRAVFLLGECLRAESQDVFRRLEKLNIRLVILTGDHHIRAQAMEQTTGVKTVGPLTPDQKGEAVRQLERPTAMVGDGINDAVALTMADVGIALDSGTDVSRNAADVCLMGGTLENLPRAIEIARMTRRAVHRNLIWAVSYNAIGIGFAVAGKLNPIVAAIAMVGSSLFVLTNTLQLAADFSVHENSHEQNDGVLTDQSTEPTPMDVRHTARVETCVGGSS